MIEIVKDERVAAALAAAGFNPAPYVGQRLDDRSASCYLPPGHRSIVTITSMSPLQAGWQATVLRTTIGPNGEIIKDGSGNGVIFIQHLFDRFAALPDLHVLDISEGEFGDLRYGIECRGITDDCRSYVENACPADCPVSGFDEDTEEWADEEAGAHGENHRLIDSTWKVATNSCLWTLMPASIADVASDLRDEHGLALPAGRYPVVLTSNSDGEDLAITVTA